MTLLKKTVKEIQDNDKPVFLGICLLLPLMALSILSFVLLKNSHEELIRLAEVRHQSYLLADQLRQSSDDLTRLVRTYAATGDKRFEQYFWEVLDIRNGTHPRPENYERIYWDFLSVADGEAPFPSGSPVSLKSLMVDAGFSGRELNYLVESQKNSDQLVDLERVAMKEMKQVVVDDAGRVIQGAANQQKALNILFGEEYHRAKVEIMRPINLFLAELDTRTLDEVNHQSVRVKSFIYMQVVVFTLSIGTVFFLISRSRDSFRSRISVLEDTVKERTAEVEAAYLELCEEVEEREEAEKKLKRLTGFLPICASCKKIREDNGYWQQVEKYVTDHSEAIFSHGLCPDCMKSLYPELPDPPDSE